MGRQEHLSNWCLEGVTLPPFGLRCRCFNWCNSHQLTLVMGETPKLKRISFGSTKIHKLLHLLLIKCYHMLWVELRNSGPFVPFHPLYHSHRHLTSHDCQFVEAPNIAMAAFASSNKASKAALSPSTWTGFRTSKIRGVESRFSNKKSSLTVNIIAFFLPEDSWLCICYIYIPATSTTWTTIGWGLPPPNIAGLQSYFSVLQYFIPFPSVLSTKSLGHVVPVSSLARPDYGPCTNLLAANWVIYFEPAENMTSQDWTMPMLQLVVPSVEKASFLKGKNPTVIYHSSPWYHACTV